MKLSSDHNAEDRGQRTTDGVWREQTEKQLATDDGRGRSAALGIIQTSSSEGARSRDRGRLHRMDTSAETQGFRIEKVLNGWTGEAH